MSDSIRSKTEKLAALDQDAVAVSYPSQRAVAAESASRRSPSMTAPQLRPQPEFNTQPVGDQQVNHKSNTGNAVIVTILTMLFVIACGVGGFGGYYLNSQLTASNEQALEVWLVLERSQSRIEELESRLLAADGEASKMDGKSQSNVLALSSKVSRLGSDVKKASNKAGSALDAVGENGKAISGVQKQLRALQGDLAGVSRKAGGGISQSALDSKVAAINKKLAALESDQGGQIDASSVQHNSKRIDKVNNDIRQIYRLLENGS